MVPEARPPPAAAAVAVANARGTTNRVGSYEAIGGGGDGWFLDWCGDSGAGAMEIHRRK